MGSNLTTVEKSQHNDNNNRISRRLFSLSKTIDLKSAAATQQQYEQQQDYLYNLFKKYTYKELYSLYLEYEYLDLLREGFCINFNLTRVPLDLAESAESSVKLPKFVKFYFINENQVNCSHTLNEYLKIESNLLISNSRYFSSMMRNATANDEDLKFYLNKLIVTYNEMYFIKKFLITGKINFELFYQSVDSTMCASSSASQQVFINEDNLLKLLEFYYKSSFFEIESLNFYIENYLFSLVSDLMLNEEQNVKIYVFLLNYTSSTHLYEFMYWRILNRFLVKFSQIFTVTTISSKNRRNFDSKIDLLSNLNKNVLIDVLRSSYLNFNELNLFKVCLKWSKAKVEQERELKKIRCVHDDDDDDYADGDMQRYNSRGGTRRFKNFFRLSSSSSFKLVKLRRNLSKILKSKNDDFVIYNECESVEEGHDSNNHTKMLIDELNEFFPYLNGNYLNNELNFLMETTGFVNEPENQYNYHEYKYLMNILNTLNETSSARVKATGEEVPPDFILNANASKQVFELNKPKRVNRYLVTKLNEYLNDEKQQQNGTDKNLPDMINSTLSKNRRHKSIDYSNDDAFESSGGNNDRTTYSFTDFDVLFFEKCKNRLLELKQNYARLYKHKKCDKKHLDNLLKLQIFRELGYNLYNSSSDAYLFDHLSSKLDFFMTNIPC